MGITIDKKRKPKKPYCLAVVASLLISAPVFAQTVSQDLTGLGMPAEQADYLAGILPAGSVLGNNTYLKGRNQANSADISVLKVDSNDDTLLNSDSGDTIVLQSQGDANRLLTYSSSSDAALALTFGDGGTTATQSLTLSSSTSDADDDSTLNLAAGGGITNGRGAYMQLFGNEVASNGGKIAFNAGDDADADIEFYIENAASTFSFQDTTSGNLLVIENDADVVASGNIDLTATGKTILVETGTAASACAGTVTANGTTAVTVNTTCAATGAHIFISRNAAPSGTAQCWTDTIVNGTSFNLDCSGAETGTFEWWIIKESA